MVCEVKGKSFRMYKKKDTCWLGHKLTPANIYVYKMKSGNNRRICKECTKIRAKDYYAKNGELTRKRALKRYYKLKEAS